MDSPMSDDHTRDLAGLTERELQQLQWDEERRFARAILAAPKGSRQRAEIVRRAYDTVTKILARLDDTAGEGLVMGLDPRYTRLVLKLLARQRRHNMQPGAMPTLVVGMFGRLVRRFRPRSASSDQRTVMLREVPFRGRRASQ